LRHRVAQLRSGGSVTSGSGAESPGRERMRGPI
jgi:hypothetical protein